MGKQEGSWKLPEALWELTSPRLPRPEPRPKGGRPPADPKKVLSSIFYVLRTGMQWKALRPSDELVSGSCAHEYFQIWAQHGVFDDVWDEALNRYDDKIGLDLEWQSMDGSMTKAPLGGEKNRAKPHRSRKTWSKTIYPRRSEWYSHRYRGSPSQRT